LALDRPKAFWHKGILVQAGWDQYARVDVSMTRIPLNTGIGLSQRMEFMEIRVNCNERGLVRLLLVLLCLGIAVGRAQDSAVSSAEAIARGNEAWIRGMQSGDASAIAETYAQDALDCGATGDCERGRRAIFLRLQKRLTRLGRASSATVTSQGSTSQGRFIYEWGVAGAKLEDGSQIGGRYLTVWQMQEDGNWKIFRNIAIP
jgi:ketosteroid isomerase-like protein